jgi:hypothetical protein
MKNFIIISFLITLGLKGYGQENDTISGFSHSNKKFNGYGYHETLNKYYQISKKGIFQNYKFMDGLWYRYDDYNRFTKIEIYKNGKFEKDSAIIYPPLKSIEGFVELKGHPNSLEYTIITQDMNNDPLLVLYKDNKEIYQKKLSASDTIEVNFEALKLDKGVYHIIIKDSISPRISEFFTIGNVSGLILK